MDGCNRPPELLGPGEKWTRESQRDLESRKNQTKLAQWFKKPSRVKVEEAEPWRPKAGLHGHHSPDPMQHELL